MPCPSHLRPRVATCAMRHRRSSSTLRCSKPRALHLECARWPQRELAGGTAGPRGLGAHPTGGGRCKSTHGTRSRRSGSRTRGATLAMAMPATSSIRRRKMVPCTATTVDVVDVSIAGRIAVRHRSLRALVCSGGKSALLRSPALSAAHHPHQVLGRDGSRALAQRLPPSVPARPRD